MKYLKYIFIGLAFGVIMFKSQAVSWFRIFEMFRFESFHMYGIIGSAVILGVLIIQVINRKKIKTINGDEILIAPKDKSISRYLFGGTIFGLGWALAGACPGPMYVLVGAQFYTMLIVLGSAIMGTFLYGMVKDKLPH